MVSRSGPSVRRVLGAAMALVAAAASAGCIGQSEPVDDYLIGLAKIGDTYHVFVPLCPGQKVVGLTVRDGESGQSPAAGQPRVWWQAGGPRSVTGPGEFLALGADEPFTDVPVRAGSDPARPVLPEDFVSEVDIVDLTGGTDRKGFVFTASEAPVHPAGTDPRTVRYFTSGEPLAPDAIRDASGCPLSNGKPPPSPGATAPGQQPGSSVRAGAAGRVERALLDADEIHGRKMTGPPSPYTDDLASSVCGNDAAKGAYSSAFGRQRQWWGGERFVIQFAGAFGAVTAAEAVAQVEGVLTCEKYRDLGDHTGVHSVPLPPLPSVDRQLMFCDRVDRFGDELRTCTVLLAEGDVLTRLIVEADTEEEAIRIAGDVAARAGAALQPVG
ncbi:hypothetical protein AB0G04_12525 [Actinoplanes sp. NPDC023801]|uniref:hypothetical protein n=1 Tax=Actinoplanes sp. NPDC023801 TaxID=3154595 RepID=UPI0033C7E8F0